MAVAGSNGGRGRGRKLTGSTPSTSLQEELPAGPVSASKGRRFRLRGRSHTNEEQLRAPIWGGYEAGKDAVVAIAGYLQDQASRQRKPENQNHAVIFTRGECLQTIDMNQEHYMEEALKMRKLLEEFLEKHDGVRYPLILGCLIPCMVHVKSRDEFCDHWAACACQSIEDSILHYVKAMSLIMNTCKLAREGMWVLIRFHYLRQSLIWSAFVPESECSQIQCFYVVIN